MFDPTTDSLKQFIKSSYIEIAELVKSTAHNKRILILASLLDGRKSFPELKIETSLSKTALANHLALMLNSNIITRIDRGSYELTKDGKELLFDIAKIYYQSENYQLKQRELLSKQYQRFRNLGDVMTKQEKRVSNVAVYQPHGLSYSSAISGILQSVGEEWGVDDVTAFTGYGFLINTSRDQICPSGPTALAAAWKTIRDATEKLGWQFRFHIDNQPFPSSTDSSQPLSKNDEKRAKEFFGKVKEAIDKYDRPVVIWGIPVPEYGIVNGYQDDYYLVSTFRTLLNQEETPIAYNKLQAPGCMDLFILEKKTHPPTDKDYRDSIVRALKMARGEGVAGGDYVAGPEAYDILQKQLLETEEEKIQPFAFAYLVDCYYCARESSFNYLNKLADKYKKENFDKYIKKAADVYGRITEQYKELQKIFPLFGAQDLSLESRKKYASILSQIKDSEEQAIVSLERIVENWK